MVYNLDILNFQHTYFHGYKIIAPYDIIFVNNVVTQLPFIHIDILKTFIEEKLHGIEGVRFSYIEHNTSWKIEYGTRPRPMMDSPVDYSTLISINRKQNAALDASLRAQTWFPHNFHDNEPIDYEDEEQPKWFKGIISLSYHIEKQEIVVGFNRLTGNSRGFYHIKNILKHLLDNKNILWLQRKHYLMLIEGTEYNIVDDVTLKFLFDPMVSREICSYL
jgi:hypothetical protein